MKILLATDGSSYAMEAASFLRSHLDPSAPLRIDLVAVLSPSGYPAASNGAHRYPEDSSKRRAGAQRWLERARDELGPALTPARSRILLGSPEDVLVREAREHDLVVAGVKGCGAAPFFEVGRVALNLLRHADCSVLLVRNQRSQKVNGHALNDPDGALGFRVLVSAAAADGDSLPVGWSVLQPFALSRASLDFVTVVDRAAGAGNAGDNGSGDPRDRTRRWLNRTAGRLRVPSGQLRCALLEGRPGAEIERHALSMEADLIVVGARRGETPGPGPLGSTARELAWCAPCSVLTVRHREVATGIQVAMVDELGPGVLPQAASGGRSIAREDTTSPAL